MIGKYMSSWIFGLLISIATPSLESFLLPDALVAKTILKSSSALDTEVCDQLTIRVCASTACAKKRRILGLDEFTTFSQMYVRANPEISVEESSCLGACKVAPCVAVEHEDYLGNIGLEGMTDEELSLGLFCKVITEDDSDRIWSCVENAVRVLSEMKGDYNE